MPQFELGGSVKTSINIELTTVFTSSFAKEMAKETSSIQNDSLYKSDFATSLLETSQHAPTPETQAAMEDAAENIYENFSADSNIYENVRQGLDSFDFGRPSQVKLYIIYIYSAKVDYQCQRVSYFRSSTAQCWRDIKVPPERASLASRGMIILLRGF